MRPYRVLSLASLLILILGLAACSDDNPTGNDDDNNGNGNGNNNSSTSLYPTSVGSTWTYAVPFGPDLIVKAVYDTVASGETWTVFDFSYGNTREHIRRQGETWLLWDEDFPDNPLTFLADGKVGTTWDERAVSEGFIPTITESYYRVVSTDSSRLINGTTWENVIVVERNITKRLKSDSSIIGTGKMRHYYARGVGLLEVQHLSVPITNESTRSLKNYDIK